MKVLIVYGAPEEAESYRDTARPIVYIYFTVWLHRLMVKPAAPEYAELAEEIKAQIVKRFAQSPHAAFAYHNNHENPHAQRYVKQYDPDVLEGMKGDDLFWEFMSPVKGFEILSGHGKIEERKM